MNFPYKFLVIEGIIGAGKTTLTEFLADKMKLEIIKERFEENPFLSRFYEDKEKFATDTEFFFLEDRIKQLKKVSLEGKRSIADFSIYKSWVFGSLNLKGDSLNLFQKKFHEKVKILPTPDLIIYLKNDLSKALDQIKSRGRSYEMQITIEYLTSIEKNYNELWSVFPHLNILEINSRILKFPYSHAQFERLLNYLSSTKINGFKQLMASDID